MAAGKRKILKTFLYDLSFVQKFIFLFICAVAVPMLIQNAVYYRQTEKNIQEEMLEKANEAMDDKAEKIGGSLSGVLSLARSYYSNETLYRCLDHEYGRDLEYLIQYQEALQALFSEINLAPYTVNSVLIYTDNDTLFNGAYVRRLEAVDIETLGENLDYVNLCRLSEGKGFYLRISHEDSRILKVHDSRSVSVLCAFDHYRQYDRYDKVLRVDLDLSSLVNILAESNIFDNMLLADSQGSVIAAAEGFPNSGAMGFFDAESAQEEKSLVLTRQIENFPLTLYGIYDMDVIAQEFRHSRRLSVAISLLCISFALVCVYVVGGNMSGRLGRLVGQSKEIARGNFVQSGAEEEAKDEFGVLEQSMNRMSEKLKELIEREYKAQLLQAELEKETNQAKFLALQSQVNPHFMFNALESIRLKAMVKGETETAQMIKYMAKMFRNLLQWEDNIIPLREEMLFLDEFLHLQKYRFGDEFSYEIEVSKEAGRCLIPKMLLQPLVENACVHGVEALTDDRWVRLEADVAEGQLMICVEDNGGGMPQEKLEELRTMLRGEQKAGRSVGLWNVYRRLALYYGEKSDFEIDSVPGKGTRCRIRIPAEEE